MVVKRQYDKYSEIYNYELISDDNKLNISFENNLDLYFTIYGKNINEFIITKENMNIYNLFNKLYNDIKNINVFEKEYVPFYIETDQEKEDYLKKTKEEYRLYNRSNYNELYNPDANTITWYSDETNSKVSNILRIKKEEDMFILNFYIQPHIEGYDRDFNSKYSITIRFRNSGSRYKPFNICFMRLFNNLQNYDPDYHQITIEEYEYRNKSNNDIKELRLQYLPKHERKK